MDAGFIQYQQDVLDEQERKANAEAKRKSAAARAAGHTGRAR
jgi:hypothetical protein